MAPRPASVKRYRVEISPTALAQIALVDVWWCGARPDATTLFVDELDELITLLEASPQVGAPYPAGAVGTMRRLLLPRTRHHVYYDVARDAGVVRIHAIWHAQRGGGPPLH